MNETPAQETCPAELPNWCAQRHWSMFWILIVCSLALVAGRVVIVKSHRAKEDTPFFSANDRSRWCTVRCLVDDGTYEIDKAINDEGSVRWDTIDKVRHLDRQGQLRFYSSKPPLLPTLVAGQYYVLNLLTGWEITTDTFPVVRVLLIFTNVIPWGIYLWFFAKMINSVPVRDWTRYYVLACAGFGTFLSTFAISLNNHLPAAIGVMISLYLVSEIYRKKDLHWIYFAATGLIAALVVTVELPALAFFACAGLICLWRSFSKTALAFVPAAAIVAGAFFGTNYLAHGEWRPAYAHRGDGEVSATLEGNFSEQLDKAVLPEAILAEATKELDLKLPMVELGCWPSTPAGTRRWVIRDQITSAQFAVVSEDGRTYQVRRWNNWYDYPQSYWLSSNDDRKSEVDRGQQSVELYTFHILFGHHGIFSLTPIWLISLAGMLALSFGVQLGGQLKMRWLGVMALALSIVVVAFYIGRPALDRNYGGVCCSLRWLLWLTPIWLVCMLPVVDWLAWTKFGKLICYVLLFASALSAFYAMENPWVHPWLYEVWDLTGLPK